MREDLALLVGEGRERGILVLPPAHALEHLAGDVGIEERAAFGHGFDGVDERLPAGLFEEVARRAGHDRREDRLVVRVGGEHDHPRLRTRLADGPARLHAVPVR